MMSFGLLGILAILGVVVLLGGVVFVIYALTGKESKPPQ